MRMEEPTSLIIDPDGSLIGTVDARQDLDQRAFSRPVFSTNGSNFSGLYPEVDVFEGIDPAEALGEVFRRQDRCAGWKVPTRRVTASPDMHHAG